MRERFSRELAGKKQGDGVEHRESPAVIRL
jgi:hypothetical protein